MRKTLILIVAMSLGTVGGAPSGVYKDFYKAGHVEGTIEKSGVLSDGSPVEIKIQKTKLPPNYPYKNAILWGGHGDSKGPILPKTIITAIDVKINGKKVFVPLSAYSDLGNVIYMSFRGTEHGFRIIIEGGTEASGYDAVLEFNKRHIVRREVVLGCFPSEYGEETVYLRRSEERQKSM